MFHLQQIMGSLISGGYLLTLNIQWTEREHSYCLRFFQGVGGESNLLSF